MGHRAMQHRRCGKVQIPSKLCSIKIKHPEEYRVSVCGLGSDSLGRLAWVIFWLCMGKKQSFSKHRAPLSCERTHSMHY